MDSYSLNPSISNFVFNHGGVLDPFRGNLGGFSGYGRIGSAPVSQSLVLDGEKGELVKAPPERVGKKNGLPEGKSLAALKNHCEAERRRRERINAHLHTLRGLVPCNEKMDKATLLAEVISQVKVLNKTATEASKGLLIPVDTDEVRVEQLDQDKAAAGGKTLNFKASLCCDYRPELLSDVRQALDALQVNIVSAEISTLGGRVKNVFVFTNRLESGVNSDNGNVNASEILVSSVHQALSLILDKASFSASPGYSPRTTLPSKRRRLSFHDSSSSSL